MGVLLRKGRPSGGQYTGSTAGSTAGGSAVRLAGAVPTRPAAFAALRLCTAPGCVPLQARVLKDSRIDKKDVHDVVLVGRKG